MNIEVLFKKINKVFKYGMYLIDWTYCVGDDKSLEKNSPECVITLNPEHVKELRKKFKDKKMIHFSVLKKTEEDIINGIEKINEEKQNKVSLYLEQQLNVINSNHPWNSFNLSEEYLSSIFDEGEIKMYKFDNIEDEFPIGKKSFPSLDKGDINDCMYKIFHTDIFGVKCCDFRYSDSDYSLDMVYLFL